MKKRLGRQGLFILTGLLMICVLVGCGMSTSKRERKIKGLFRDKYGEEFEVRELYANSGVHAWCYPESDPSLIFEIETPTKLDKIVADDYLQCIVERQLNEELQPFVDEEFEDSFISSDIPLGATTNFQNPDAQNVNLDNLLDYINSEGLSDHIFLNVFVSKANNDLEREYQFISKIGEMYQTGVLPYPVLVIYFGDESFIYESKELIGEYGWTIAMGSDSRYDIYDLVNDKKEIIIHYYEDGKPRIFGTEKEQWTDLDYEKYQELRMEAVK